MIERPLSEHARITRPDVADVGQVGDVLERARESTDVRDAPFDRWLDVGRPREHLDATDWRLEELDGRVGGEVATARPNATARSAVTVSPTGPGRHSSRTHPPTAAQR